jgi:hypothetical protein
VGRAWAIKEALRCLWHDVYPASGWKFWKRWYFGATHSRLEPIRKAAETVRRHIDNILTYDQHPVTNAMSEGLTSQIQKLTSMACGFRNIENFKPAIYFHCGGLDLSPSPCETQTRLNYLLPPRGLSRHLMRTSIRPPTVQRKRSRSAITLKTAVEIAENEQSQNILTI